MKKILLVGLVGILSCFSLASCSYFNKKDEVSSSVDTLQIKMNEINKCLSSSAYHYKVYENNYDIKLEQAISFEIYYTSINDLYTEYNFSNGTHIFDGFNMKGKYQSKYKKEVYSNTTNSSYDTRYFYEYDIKAEEKDNKVLFSAPISLILGGTYLLEFRNLLSKEVLVQTQMANFEVQFDNEKVSKVIIDASNVTTYSGNKYNFELTYYSYGDANYVPEVNLSEYKELDDGNIYENFDIYKDYQHTLYYSALEKKNLIKIQSDIDTIFLSSNSICCSLICEGHDDIGVIKYIRIKELTNTGEKNAEGKTKFTYEFFNNTYEIYYFVEN